MKMRWWNFKVTYENYFPANGVSHFTKILTYATDDVKEAEKIAKAGQIRTLKDHNTRKRCEFINHVISNDK